MSYMIKEYPEIVQKAVLLSRKSYLARFGDKEIHDMDTLLNKKIIQIIGFLFAEGIKPSFQEKYTSLFWSHIHSIKDLAEVERLIREYYIFPYETIQVGEEIFNV